jgi:hypothetical protein
MECNGQEVLGKCVLTAQDQCFRHFRISSAQMIDEICFQNIKP